MENLNSVIREVEEINMSSFVLEDDKYESLAAAATAQIRASSASALASSICEDAERFASAFLEDVSLLLTSILGC